MPNSAEVEKLDNTFVPITNMYVSEEVSQGECNYCDPAYIARGRYWNNNTWANDWINKNAGYQSIGIRIF